MKRMILGMFLTTLMLGAQVVNAQVAEKKDVRKRMSPEQMTEIRINRMVNELALDDASAVKFTEVYKKYMEEMSNLRSTCPLKAKKEEGKSYRRTDAEVEKSIEERFAMSRKKLDIREKYYKEFRKFLSPRQVEKIYMKEKSYGDAMRKEWGRRNALRNQHHKTGRVNR